MTTYTYKNKGDQARALLIEGKSAKEISEVTGLAAGTIGIYFYKMKQKGEIDGTTSKPIANEKSALFLKQIRIVETASEDTTTEDQTPTKEPTATDAPKAPAKEEAPPASPPKKSSIESTILETVNELVNKTMPLLNLKELIKDLSKRLALKQEHVEFTVRLIRSNGVIEQIAKVQNIPLTHVQKIRDALELNQLLGEAKPTGNVSQPDFLLVTKPIEGLEAKAHAAIESHLLSNMNARAVSHAVKIDIKYVYQVQLALEKMGKIKLTLDRAYGKETVMKIKSCLLDGKSIAETQAKFPEIPREAIMTLANHVPSRAERYKHNQMKARQMFLAGKNAFDVARDLALDFEQANTVFIEMKKERLIDGTSVKPMLVDSLGKIIETPSSTPTPPAKPIQQLGNLPMHDKEKIAALAEDAREGKFNLFDHLKPQGAANQSEQLKEKQADQADVPKEEASDVKKETSPETEQTTVEPVAAEQSVAVPLSAPDAKTEQSEEVKPPFPLVEETFRDASDVEYKQLAMADEENSLVKQLAASISELPQHLIPSGLQIKTNLNLNRQRVDLATVRLQFEHMLKMAEMSGNTEFDVMINIASVT